MKPFPPLWRVVTVTLVWLSLVAVRAADPFAAGVRATEPLTPEEQRKTFKLPPGFAIQLVAAEPDLRKPMNMAFDAAGRLWVTESREYPFAATNGATARDTIRIFADFDATGRARKVTTFATNLNIPIGIYPFRSPASGGLGSTPAQTNQGAGGTAPSRLTWKCLAWSIPNIWLFEDTDGDGVADKKELLYGPFDHTRDTHGNQASFRRGNDGWIYATHGFNNQSRVAGRDGHEIFLPSGNIYRFRLDGSHLEHWTHGQVNPFGLCFDPLGNLYSADCHSSPIYQLLRGGSYPSFGRPHDGLGFAPVTIQHSHGSTAICGITYISDPSWPAEYQDNIFIGNVMTSRINRDKINFLGSTSKGVEQPDFLSTTDPWFRPVDLQFGPDGALWVADFYNRIIGHYEVPLLHPGRDRERGRIWRIVPPGGADVSRLKLVPGEKSVTARYQTADLAEELGSPNPTRRSLAQHELVDCVGTNALEMLKETARGIYDFPTPQAKGLARVHALWALLNLQHLGDLEMNTAIDDPNPLLRAHLMRLAAEIGLQAAGKIAGAKPPHDPGNFRALMLMHMDDPSAHVQRAAADALAANPHPDNLAPLLALQKRVPTEDTHLTYVVRLALRAQLRLPGAFGQLPALNEADSRVAADVAAGVPSPEAAAFLLRHLETYPEKGETQTRYLKHAGLHVPDSALDAFARQAQTRFAADLDLQATLFKAVQDGAAQRGATLGAGTRDWGAALAAKLLGPADTSTAAWSNSPLAAGDARSPWAFEERACADGQKAQFMSSLPQGEARTGVLRSAPFPLPAKMSFYLCGHDGPPGKAALKKNFVRLVSADTKQALREAAPPRSDTAQKITWDLAEFAGQQAFLEVTDGDDGSAYAWLAFGRFEPALPQLALGSPASLASRHQAAADIARTLKLAGLEPQLGRLFSTTGTDATTRAASGRALAAINPAATTPALVKVFSDATEPSALREQVALALAEANTPAATAALVGALRQAPLKVQRAIVTALAGSGGGAETVLKAVADGHAAPALLRERALADKLAASLPTAKERITQLTKNLPPADAAVQKLLDQRRAAFDPAKSRAAEGAKVFEKTCTVCHQLEGKGGLVGPQLDGIGGRGLERLLEDVLDPNRNVDRAFRTHLLTLKDGDVVSGLPRREEGELLVLADGVGKEFTVPKKNVKERRETELSLMPDNFGEALPAADLNDLLAFLLAKVASGR